jgi:hypothetical protein
MPRFSPSCRGRLRGMEENPYKAPLEHQQAQQNEGERRQPWWVVFASIAVSIVCGFVALNMPNTEPMKGKWQLACLLFGGLACLMFVSNILNRDKAA